MRTVACSVIRDVPWTPAVKEAMLGRSGTAAGETLAGFSGDPPARAGALMDELNGRFADVLATRTVEPMPGAAALVARLAAAALPLAVASNSPAHLVARVLDRVGLAPAFAHVVCAGPPLAPKPAPDVYATACAALGVPVARAVALEDSPTGVRAARAAGLYTIAVPSLGSGIGAHYEVASLNDLAAIVDAWLTPST